MAEIQGGLPVYMLIGIVVVIGVSQLNRIAGGVLGLLFWGVVAYIGNDVYLQGNKIGLPGIPFSKVAFFALCGVMASFQAAGIFHSVQQKRRAQLRAQTSQVDD